MQGFFDVDACFGYLNDRVLPATIYRSEPPLKRNIGHFHKKYSKEQRDKAIELYNQGISAAKIGRSLNIPAPTIENFIKDYRNGRTTQGN